MSEDDQPEDEANQGEEVRTGGSAFKRIGTFLFVVLVIGGIGRAIAGNGNSEDTTTASETAVVEETEAASEDVGETIKGLVGEVTNEEPAEPAIEVDVVTLLEAYAANELAADQQYKDKLLSVTGVVGQVSEVLGQKAVEVTDGSEWAFNSVSCFIDDSQLDKAAALTAGQPVTVEGYNDGFNQISIQLSECIIK